MLVPILAALLTLRGALGSRPESEENRRVPGRLAVRNSFVNVFRR